MSCVTSIIEHEAVEGKGVAEGVSVGAGFSRVVKRNDVIQRNVGEERDLMDGADS